MDNICATASRPSLNCKCQLISVLLSIKGKPCSNKKKHRISHWVRSDEGAATQKKVWKEILDKLESIQLGVTSNI